MKELMKRRRKHKRVLADEWNEDAYSRKLTIRKYKKTKISSVIDKTQEEIDIIDSDIDNYTDEIVTEYMARELGWK